MVTTREILNNVCAEVGATATERSYYAFAMHRESGGRANAKNPDSSASGLFQFLDQTWLAQMDKDGAKYGYGRYADAIEQGRDGRYYVRGGDALRREILNLRFNPEASSQMMVEFSRDNIAIMRTALGGREPTAGDMYLAHFLGPAGAKKILEADSGRRINDGVDGTRDLVSDAVIAANPTIRNFTAGQLRAWAQGEANGGIGAAVEYHNAPSHTSEETEAERSDRIRLLRDMGVSEERIDELNPEEMVGAGFFLLLLTVISEIAKTSEQDVAVALPEVAAAAATPPASSRATHAGLAAAVAAVPDSLRQPPTEANPGESIPAQLTELARPAAVTRAPGTASA